MDSSRSLAGLGSRSLSALDRLRRSVLPDRDDALPLESESTADLPATRSHSRRAFSLVPGILLGVVVAMLAVAVALFVFRGLYSDKIYPAVIVGDVNVGGLTAAQAEERLTERANELEQGTIAFTYNGQTWTPTLAELGASVNLSDSVESAQELGRGGDAASRLAFTNDILRSDQVVPLQTTVNLGVLNTWFDKVDADINNPAINAAIVIDGSAVSVSPDSTGIVVDRDAARKQILATLSSLQPLDTELPTVVDVPEIHAKDLGAVLATVEAAVQTPLRGAVRKPDLADRGRNPRQVHARGNGHGEWQAHRHPELRYRAAGRRPARAVRAGDQPRSGQCPRRLERREGLIALDPSTTGATLKATAFAEAVAEGFLNGESRIDIPVVIVRPEIDDENLDALGITTLLGRGDSNFAGGAWGRDQNILVGTSLLNGTLVPPGGTFSFNQAVGEITYEKGYQEADVVVAEQIGRDVGGGICQVSTTVFRAALLAGMPIAEWNQHTYRLSGYERDGWGPGFDASILQNSWQSPEEWPDFKFENYTDSWLLVESWTSYPHVIVNIYGTGDGREVDLDAWGINGKNAGFTRVIYDAQGNVIAERSFASYFK